MVYNIVLGKRGIMFVMALLTKCSRCKTLGGLVSTNHLSNTFFKSCIQCRNVQCLIAYTHHFLFCAQFLHIFIKLNKNYKSFSLHTIQNHIKQNQYINYNLIDAYCICKCYDFYFCISALALLIQVGIRHCQCLFTLVSTHKHHYFLVIQCSYFQEYFMAIRVCSVYFI